MDDVSVQKELEATLATELCALWEQAHGTLAGQVRVLARPDTVAAWIENVLSPAERAVTQRAEGQRLMQRYAEQLLTVIQPDLRARVEAITGRRILSDSVRADVDTGHVLCFFILGEQQARVATPGDESSTEGGRYARTEKPEDLVSC